MKSFVNFLTILLLLGGAIGCGDDAPTPVVDAGSDAGTPGDAGADTPTPADAGADAVADAGTDAGPELPAEDDTVHTNLNLNLDALTGVAELTIRDDGDGVTWLHVPSADVVVTRGDGSVVTPMVDAEDPLFIGVPISAPSETLSFAYAFSGDRPAMGFSSELGFSLIWPNYCGALYPCDNHPKDGTTFEAVVTYTGAGTVVYPQSIPAQAPSYLFAVAVGEFEKVELGTTTAGTRVASWLPADASAELRNVTSNLSAQFDWYESTYGEYIFGDEVGSVYVPNNDVGIGGMEHHPYWHVVEGAFTDATVHAHEAAHGWYGNGVRIECWEDFVLSEGVVSYMTARAMGATGGETAQDAVFAEYSDGIDSQIASGRSGIAWVRDTCDPNVQFDMSELWSADPYWKGALFFRAVAGRSSFDAVDAALASFYAEHKETAQRMQALIDHLEAELSLDLTAEVDGWLLNSGRPD